MNEKLIEAKEILAEKRMLLKKYPNKFSFRVDVRQWSGIVDNLELEDNVRKNRSKR